MSRLKSSNRLKPTSCQPGMQEITSANDSHLMWFSEEEAVINL